MKEVDLSLPPCVTDGHPTSSLLQFKNKLADQDKSFMNQTYTIDTTKKERSKEFNIDDAIRGYLPRARSSDPRRSFRNRAITGSQSMFSAHCKLPSLDGHHLENKTCTLRPWSRTQEELRKYKEALK
uniref:Testis expressed 26 n=1 Tax=Heterorhabditis bacteriophora TaxID=37862 RepID=A0A1I7XLI5_HETBA